jgi:hypothetical protein
VIETPVRGIGTVADGCTDPERAEICHRGILLDGELSVEYYTSQPAPTQWIAVGKVAQTGSARVLLLLVGVGRDEQGAVDHLQHRLSMAHSRA